MTKKCHRSSLFHNAVNPDDALKVITYVRYDMTLVKILIFIVQMNCSLKNVSVNK
jgi:hypothetical protein